MLVIANDDSRELKESKALSNSILSEEVNPKKEDKGSELATKESNSSKDLNDSKLPKLDAFKLPKVIHKELLELQIREQKLNNATEDLWTALQSAIDDYALKDIIIPELVKEVEEKLILRAKSTDK